MMAQPKKQRNKSVKCPLCRRKMQSFKNEFPVDTEDKILWQCSFCKLLFKIKQYPYYPLERTESPENEEEAEEQPTEIDPVLANMTCQDCGTTENIGDTGLCAFCEEDRIVDEEERDFDEFEEAEEQQ